MVFQNPFASLNPRKKIGQALEEPLAINTRSGKAERDGARPAMLARVGLSPEHYRRYPHMFSGGQRQRVAIARALMLEPRLVIADEPVSALDVSIQAQVLNLLMDLQEATGVAYVFISHNLAVVELIADEVIVMYLGRVMERAPKAALFAAPRHPYTRALLASTPRVDGAHGEAALERAARSALTGDLPSPLAPPSGCVFRTRCPYAIARCAEVVPPLEAVGDGHSPPASAWPRSADAQPGRRASRPRSPRAASPATSGAHAASATRPGRCGGSRSSARSALG